MVNTNKSSSYIQDPPSDFGIRLIQGEEIILSLRPAGFVRYWVVYTCLLIIGIPLIPITYLIASLALRRYHYWLTNKRVIWCHGIIGYRVRSVPLERISDVVLSRTFTELIAGITSIEIKDMTGQTTATVAHGSTWIGVLNASEVQQRILEEIKKVNEQTRRV